MDKPDNSPLHLGLTQQWAVCRYSNIVPGKSAGPYVTPVVRITRADSSLSDGGFNDISSTKRTTSGFSRRDSCVFYFFKKND